MLFADKLGMPKKIKDLPDFLLGPQDTNVSSMSSVSHYDPLTMQI